jgi:hypothetical protein
VILALRSGSPSWMTLDLRPLSYQRQRLTLLRFQTRTAAFRLEVKIGNIGNVPFPPDSAATSAQDE